MSYNYKLILAYDGTRYGGWQVQPNSVTIQEILQKKAAMILKNPVSIIGSGRTDAGVHAIGQAAHFHFPSQINLSRFLWSMNGVLPNDIRVKSIEQAAGDFHSQYSATGKTYHYHLHLDKVIDPFRRLYSLHVKERISISLLKSAAQHFIGTHDFTSFANEAHLGSAARDPMRTIRRLDIVIQEGGIRIEIEADGFLYKMVRNIVGVLLEVGNSELSDEEIPKIFEARDRKMAGKTVPSHGLFLVKVDY